MLLYFIGSDLGPSGVASCAEILQKIHPNSVRLVYLNCNSRQAKLTRDRIYIPVQSSHKVDFVTNLIKESGWLNEFPLWIMPNNSTVAYDVALNIFMMLQKKIGLQCDAYVVGVIHSNSDASINLVIRNSFFLSSIISVSKEIFSKVESWNIERIPHLNLMYPNKFYLRNVVNTDPALPLRIVYVGRLEEEQKRVSRLVKLLDALNSAGEPFSVNVYGSGELFHELALQKQRFDALKSSVELQLHGRVEHDEVERLLSRSDVMVLTSDFEGSPLVILEAMSMGVVPVVMYYGAEVRELIDHRENGFVVGRGDVEAMALVLCDLSKDRSTLQRLKRASLASSRARVSPSLWFDALQRIAHRRITFPIDRRTALANLIELARKRVTRFRGDEQLAIWGAGELGRTLFDVIKECRPELEIVVMVDEKLSTYISNYCNVELVKPSQLLAYYIDEILIASRYFVAEITDQVNTLYEERQDKPAVSQPFTIDIHNLATKTTLGVDASTFENP